MTSGGIDGSADKRALRVTMMVRRAASPRRIRDAFAADVPDIARALVASCAADLRRKPRVALYSALPDEAPTAAIATRLADDDIPLALPVICARGTPLTFRALFPGTALRPGPFGILQPDAGPDVSPDVIFVPLVAFDAAGSRLGYGGGYYDRTLAALRATSSIRAFGLAFSTQRVEAVPREAHDAVLDGILTEDGLMTTRPNSDEVQRYRIHASRC